MNFRKPSETVRLLILLALMMPVSLSAKDVTYQKALMAAQEFFSHRASSSTTKRAPAVPRLTLARKAASNDHADYYVFNDISGKGFVIIAGDDQANMVLGYSLTSSFPDEMPDNLTSWLDGYSRQIAFIRSHGLRNVYAQARTFQAAKPLLDNIRWGQDHPYNGMTPCYVGTTHSPTGCVATAMAQIMYYYRWPEQGRGQHSYIPYSGKNTLSADFSQSQYGWDAMLPIYTGSETDTAKNAVSLLMRDCGYSVDMMYSRQSGADEHLCPNAFATYFNYDSCLVLRTRQYYSESDWDDIIRGEIDEGRPVFASGDASAGGHAFVFDGYDADGLIHVNWGWNGMSNGYFRTSALTPAMQGTGGSDGGFNYNQTIITGIQPPRKGSEKQLEIVSTERLKASPEEVDAGTSCTLKLTGKVINYGWQEVTTAFGIGIFNADNVLVAVLPADKNGYFKMPANSYTIGISCSDVDFGQLGKDVLPDGQYTLRPVAQNMNGSKWQIIHEFNYNKSNRLFMTVNGTHFSFVQPSEYKLIADSARLTTKVYQNVNGMIRATVRNTGETEYSGNIKAALYKSDMSERVAVGDDQICDIMPGDSAEVAVMFKFGADPGDYNLVLINSDYTMLHEPIACTVLAAPDTYDDIQAADQVTFGDNDHVNKDSMLLTAHLRCVSLVYSGNISPFIFDAQGKSVIGGLEPEFVFAEQGQEQTVVFHGHMDNAVPGETYKAALVNLNRTAYLEPMNLASVMFTIAEPTGIREVRVDSDRQPVYRLDGSRVQDGSRLPSGIYIRGGQKLVIK